MSTLGKSDKEPSDRGSTSSGLTEIDIWDVSESEFHFTSEVDEESSDEDTADSCISFDGGHNETKERQNLDSFSHNSSTKSLHGSPLIRGNGSQPIVLNDRTSHVSNTLSRDERVDEGPTTEDRRPKKGNEHQETVYPGKTDGLSGEDVEEGLLLETRSMTQRIKAAQKSRSGDKSSSFSTMEAENDQQQLNHRVERIPIPHSLDEAGAADIMLLEMKEKGRSWLEIEKAWEKKTGKSHAAKSLFCRYNRIMANFASTRPKASKKAGRFCSTTKSQLGPEDVSYSDPFARSD